MEENKNTKSRAFVAVTEDGPIEITGNFIIKDIKRNKESSPGEVWLCRCGKSSDKPYCDQSHKKK
jgi:CDGSH-type Zn-finger protein